MGDEEITLPLSRYEAIVEAALDGDLDEVRRLDELARREAGVVRYVLWVRWVQLEGRAHRRPDVVNWPPERRIKLTRSVPFEKQDVLDALDARKANPIAVHVTSDPDGELGWFELDAFDFTTMQ